MHAAIREADRLLALHYDKAIERITPPLDPTDEVPGESEGVPVSQRESGE